MSTTSPGQGTLRRNRLSPQGASHPGGERRYYLALDDGLLIAEARAGGGWRQTMRLAGYPLTALIVDPCQPARLYCAVAGYGLLVSADAANSWLPVTQGLISPSVTALAVSAVDRQEGLGLVYAGTEPAALYCSEDGGASWLECVGLHQVSGQERWADPLRPSSQWVSALACDAHVSARLLLSISGAGVLSSRDGGLRFSISEGGAQWVVSSLLSHPRQKETAIAAGFCSQMQRGIDACGRAFPWPRQGGALLSVDGGASFQPLTQGAEQHPAFWQVVADPADATHLLASATVGPLQGSLPAFAEAVLYRRQGEQPWQPVRQGLPEPEHTTRYALATHIEEPGVFYAATGSGIYRAEGDSPFVRLLALPERFRARHVRSLLVWPP